MESICYTRNELISDLTTSACLVLTENHMAFAIPLLARRQSVWDLCGISLLGRPAKIGVIAQNVQSAKPVYFPNLLQKEELVKLTAHGFTLLSRGPQVRLERTVERRPPRSERDFVWDLVWDFLAEIAQRLGIRLRSLSR